MPQILWTTYFLEAQGYGTDENILYKYNMSVVLLENNGGESITNNPKHINVRYYFIKEQVESGEGVIEHCQTTDILGNHFTKPLKGALFMKFRAEMIIIPYYLNM